MSMLSLPVALAATIVFSGDGSVSVAASADGAEPRLEVTFLAPGRWEDALDGNMSYEAEYLEKFAPADGFDGVVEAKVHPGEDARFELRVDGPVKNPSFTVLGRKFSFPVELGADDRLFVKGGRWRAEKVVPGANDSERRTKMSERRLIAEGALEGPLPCLPAGGATLLRFSSPEPASAQAHVALVKRYNLTVKDKRE